MIRKEAIATIAKEIKNHLIVSANGYISRDLFKTCDKQSNFYMIGSMGLASSIGLGIALKNPKKLVYVFDGDGNLLMNLGSLTTIGSLKPRNLIHVVFDNSRHESTGGQPTSTTTIKIDKIARAANYKVFRTRTKKGLVNILNETKRKNGPLMILVKVEISNTVSQRIKKQPVQIKNEFMKAL